MPETLAVRINGRDLRVANGTSVAAAILNSGVAIYRRSVEGDPRGPVCGMGICYECRARIDGTAHRRSCMIACSDGMVIETDA